MTLTGRGEGISFLQVGICVLWLLSTKKFYPSALGFVADFREDWKEYRNGL